MWTTAAYKIAELRNRIRVVQGGTSAGKTYSILQLLIFLCLNKAYDVSVVAESIPHLRRGALKDFLKIMSAMGLLKQGNFNKSTLTYTFDNGAIMEFFSADQPDKLRGARRDVLFINECNNVDLESFNQLEVRTRKFCYLDYNPTHEFWVQSDLLNNPDIDTGFVKVTYKDNEALSPQIVASIESRKNNPYWWRVYGLGETGILEGAIFPNWRKGKFNESLSAGLGLDFGFSPDPTALIKVAVDETQKLIHVKQLGYAQRLTEADIINLLTKNCSKDEMIIADNAESRLIQAIRDKGFNIFAAEKGAGSIREGILYIQDYTIVVDDSPDMEKELTNYCWNDKRAGIPIDKFNHLCDAMRYAIERLRTPAFYFG